MRTLEAKDFLVQQTAQQAQLESVPFSDLEKRMLYFTESGYVPEDPVKLNDEFEAQYETEEYEAKVSRLLHHAYQRLRKENDAARKNWDIAIKCLRRGDHYLLVMWDLAPSTWTPVSDSQKLLASALGVIALAFSAVFIAQKLGPQWRWLQKKISTPNSRILFGIFITVLLAGFFFPRQVGNAVDWLLDRRFFRFFLGPKEDEKDSE
jgi:hypothetical protein